MLAYAGITVVIGGGVLLLLLATGQSTWVFLVVAFFFFVVARIPGIYWRDFWRGRRLLDEGSYEQAIGYFEKFLERIRRQPWIKHLMWLNWGFYTRDIEAMTQNNLGAAKLNAGLLREAETHLRTAVHLDPYYPVPFFNLALLAQVEGDSDNAKSLLKQAQQLGYHPSGIDRLIAQAVSILARLEGTGIAKLSQSK